MLPEPLHPAVVHFPVVLSLLLPLVALGAVWAVRRGARPRRAWSLTVLVAAALFSSSYLAVETGEKEEERVEETVAEQAIHTHEERGEFFLYLAGGTLVLTGLGLAGGMVGRAGRYASIGAALALVVAGWRVGRTGGELVYRHGAAAAYTNEAGLAGRKVERGGAEGALGLPDSPSPERWEHEEGEDDDGG